jgi:hypothetical protein
MYPNKSYSDGLMVAFEALDLPNPLSGGSLWEESLLFCDPTYREKQSRSDREP